MAGATTCATRAWRLLTEPAGLPSVSTHRMVIRSSSHLGRVRYLGVGVALALHLGLTPAAATWSVVAVDARTREVGSAGASCTPFVAGIVALAPGRGALVAQAMSNAAARRRGVQLLAAGGSPSAIVGAISHSAFDDTYQEQQYGVVALDFFDRPAAFTGARTHAEAGHLLAPGVSVQGNILTGRDVLTATMDAFTRSAGRPLAERLLVALEAGAQRGGDRRCGSQTARSAYLVVAAPGDPPDRPGIRYVIPGQSQGGRNPVHLLRRGFATAGVRRSPADVACQPGWPGRDRPRRDAARARSTHGLFPPTRALIQSPTFCSHTRQAGSSCQASMPWGAPSISTPCTSALLAVRRAR